MMLPFEQPRLVKVSKPGAEVGGRYEYVGQDSSQNVEVKFWLDVPTGAATNDLLKENGPMHVLVRKAQVMEASPIKTKSRTG